MRKAAAGGCHEPVQPYPPDRVAHRGDLSDSVMRTLAEESPDAIMVVDALGRLIWVNHQVESLFGYGQAELLGQSVELLVAPRGPADPPDSSDCLHGESAHPSDGCRNRPRGAAERRYYLQRRGQPDATVDRQRRQRDRHRTRRQRATGDLRPTGGAAAGGDAGGGRRAASQRSCSRWRKKSAACLRSRAGLWPVTSRTKRSRPSPPAIPPKRRYRWGCSRPIVQNGLSWQVAREWAPGSDRPRRGRPRARIRHYLLRRERRSLSRGACGASSRLSSTRGPDHLRRPKLALPTSPSWLRLRSPTPRRASSCGVCRGAGRAAPGGDARRQGSHARGGLHGSRRGGRQGARRRLHEHGKVSP